MCVYPTATPPLCHTSWSPWSQCPPDDCNATITRTRQCNVTDPTCRCLSDVTTEVAPCNPCPSTTTPYFTSSTGQYGARRLAGFLKTHCASKVLWQQSARTHVFAFHCNARQRPCCTAVNDGSGHVVRPGVPTKVSRRRFEFSGRSDANESAYTHTRTHACIRTHIQSRAHAQTPECPHAHSDTHTYTRTHTHSRKRRHTQ